MSVTLSRGTTSRSGRIMYGHVVQDDSCSSTVFTAICVFISRRFGVLRGKNKFRPVYCDGATCGATYGATFNPDQPHIECRKSRTKVSIVRRGHIESPVYWCFADSTWMTLTLCQGHRDKYKNFTVHIITLELCELEIGRAHV